MRKEILEGLKTFLSTSRKIVVTNHVNPDGDAMGSANALSALLRKEGHETNVIVPNDYPHFLKWLPGSDEVVVFDENASKAEKILVEAEMVIVLDYNALHRSGPMLGVLENFSGKFLMIDHHQQPGEFAEWIVSDTSKCSTAQMVYEFAEDLELLDGLTKEVAENLYTGIVTDTGSFRFSSTTAQTHRIVANLLEAGVQPDQVYNNVFDANSVSRFKLLGNMLDHMQVYQEKSSVILYLSNEAQKELGFRKGDSEGFVNYGLSLEGITFSVFIREEEGYCKVSLRSKGDLDVNQISRNNFNGGGHKNAAGGLVEKDLAGTIEIAQKVINTL
ncbi:MAG: bifunctional oligoribonuclease/PAP phosphatase NrnA [Schleiferiaceae bacterium]|nr:bifunctional oligoribonuclease/PAP phosphatase NrnA [Schleiferiaceae bacterium]